MTMDRIDQIKPERSESFELGYFAAKEDLSCGNPYNDGAGQGTSADYQEGYAVSYADGPARPRIAPPATDEARAASGAWQAERERKAAEQRKARAACPLRHRWPHHVGGVFAGCTCP